MFALPYAPEMSRKRNIQYVEYEGLDGLSNGLNDILITSCNVTWGTVMQDIN